MLTHYKDMKSDETCKIGMVWGLGVPQGHWQHNHLLERVRLHIQL